MQLRYLVALSCLTACTANVEEHNSSQSSPLQGGSTAICHATGSSTNPFVLITVSSSALAAHQHHHHGHDIIPAPAEGCSGETPPPFCTPGSTIACYEGPTGTEGVGTCASGTQTCAEDGGSFGPCTGSVEPIAEVCGDALDNDCDGLTDERCIGDFAWDDLDNDGVQDAGEPGLAGVIINLRVGNVVIASTVSDSNGSYHFAEVPAGTYNLQAPVIAGYVMSPIDVGDDALDSDFGGFLDNTPDFVFPDNGTIDDLDVGMAVFVPD